MADFRDISKRPTTLQEAVSRLVAVLSEEEKARLLAMPETDLIDLHFGLGIQIRNAFGLHGDNPELLASCGSLHPDDASMVIIRALWEKLRSRPH